MISKNCFLLIIALFLVNTSLVFGQDTRFFPSTTKYDIDLKVDYSSGKLSATGILSLLNNTNQPIDQLDVLLYRMLKVSSVISEGSQLLFEEDIVSVEGWEKLQVNYVKINLKRILQPGEEISLEIDYEGYLCGYSEAGWNYVKDHVDADFTIIRTDGFGYPVIGYPSDKEMMSITKEIYDYKLKITVPKGKTVVTGGRLLNQSTAGDWSTFAFCSKRPSWRMDIIISDYQMLMAGQNLVCFFKQDSASASGLISAMEKSLNLYSNWFGEIEGYQGYSIIEVPEGYGSQSDAAAIMITADNFKKDPPYFTIYHELAHLWNVRNLESEACRLESEGLAQFLQFLLAEKLDNKVNSVKEAANRYLMQMNSNMSKRIELQSIQIRDYGKYNLTQYSYTVGMVFFALYYDLVGHDRFSEIIKTYYEKNYKTGATFDDFVIHCEKRSKDLNQFFFDWFHSTKILEMIREGKTYDDLLQYYTPVHT